jgi:N-acetylmuramoyl-L-alanine amidase
MATRVGAGRGGHTTSFRPGIWRRGLILSLIIALVPLAWSGPLRAADGSLAQGIRLTDSPFSPDGDGIRDQVLLDVTLRAAATVTVSVVDFKGKAVRTMPVAYHEPGTVTWRWNGRDDGARLVPDGPYRFRVDLISQDGLTENLVVPLAKAPVAPYVANPGAVTVVINACHGGPDPGAVYGGVEESRMNLDIARRLEQMLGSSGVTVVMVRDSDVAVNAAGRDLNGDGRVNRSDELLARNDVANLARGDLYVTLMNNAYGCHCVRGTETWTHDERSWSPEALVLASSIQRAHMRRLRPFRHAGWYPIDRGVRFHDFAVVRPYSKQMRRPALMTSVMTESLFMDHANELRILKKPTVRNELAVAFFEGITEWLDDRAYGLGYEVLEATSGEVPAGGSAEYTFQLTNSGNRTSSGWRLRASFVPAVPYYDGSDRVGTVLGSVAIPDGLEPGASTSVSLDGLTLPQERGQWLVKFDVELPDGDSLGRHGVVGPQVAITTVTPDPTPEPPSADPSTEPTSEPSADPTSDRIGTIPDHDHRAGAGPREHPEGTPRRVGPVLEPPPKDIWMHPPPGWGNDAWREILADVVRQIDHDPEHHHGHHHGDE